MALGKKLDSLLENYFGAEDLISGKDQLLELEVSKIIASPYQPRTHFDQKNLESLAQNIADHGLLQPITVIDLGNGNYQLISGERRFRSFEILKKEFIPAIVKDKTILNEKQQATLGIFENLHRENLSPMDTAKAFASLKQMHSWSNQELANFLNCSKQHIDNYFRLFDLSPDVQEALTKNQLSEGHARMLHSFDFSAQSQILKKIIDSDLSVKGTQKYIDSFFKSKIKSIKPLTSQIRENLNAWKTKFPNAKVSFNGTSKRGSLIIKWTDEDGFPQI